MHLSRIAIAGVGADEACAAPNPKQTGWIETTNAHYCLPGDSDKQNTYRRIAFRLAYA
jgi:hypothetical protein